MRCLRRAMTLVRLWRLPLGEDSLTLLYETLRERYRRRALYQNRYCRRLCLLEVVCAFQMLVN
jgi:hypothetical protein